MNSLDTELVHAGSGIYVVRAAQGGWSQHGSAETPEAAEDNALRRLVAIMGTGGKPMEDIRNRYAAELQRTGLDADQVRAIMIREFGVKHSRDLSEEESLILYGILRSYPTQEKTNGKK